MFSLSFRFWRVFKKLLYPIFSLFIAFNTEFDSFGSLSELDDEVSSLKYSLKSWFINVVLFFVSVVSSISTLLFVLILNESFLFIFERVISLMGVISYYWSFDYWLFFMISFLRSWDTFLFRTCFGTGKSPPCSAVRSNLFIYS